MFSARRIAPCVGCHSCQQKLITLSIRCYKSYFGEFDDHEREQTLQRSKYAKRGNKQKIISVRDISIPQSQIRQFVKIVHPDRFQLFLNKSSSQEMNYTAEQLSMMQQVNGKNLSTFNSILEFSRKHAKLINTELFKSQSPDKAHMVHDRRLTENAPNPTNFEFYIEKQYEAVYFEHVYAKFDCKESRPYISEYFGTLNTTLTTLFRTCDIDIQSMERSTDDSGETVKKFSELDIDKAMKIANNGEESAQSMVDDALKEHLSPETQARHKLHGVNAMQYKIDNKKVYFAPNLNEVHMQAAMDMLYKASSEYAVDLVFDVWIDVPILVCRDELECRKCPNYVVAIPWYCDVEEFVLYVQDQIVDIHEKYKQRKHQVIAKTLRTKLAASTSN